MIRYHNVLLSDSKDLMTEVSGLDKTLQSLQKEFQVKGEESIKVSSTLNRELLELDTQYQALLAETDQLKLHLGAFLEPIDVS